MTRPSPLIGRVLSAAAGLIVLAASSAPAQDAEPVPTLCVLDFQRLGDDARSDWLAQGLADLMINTMGSVSPYLVVERKHLREILLEQGLTKTGLIDVPTAVRRAQLVKAQLLLQGSFARLGDQLTVQVRLIRVADQQVLTEVRWTDRHTNVLSAPRVLSQELLRSLNRPYDPGKLAGLEHQVPTTIDVAQSYYEGLRSFDAGLYPAALAHYLDAATRARDFRNADLAILGMYYLLGRSDHAVLFARTRARFHEASGDAPGAIEYYFAAAREYLGPLNDPRSARDLLQELLHVLERHERRTGEMAATRRSILERIETLRQTGERDDPERVLADRVLRDQVWLDDIDRELTRRTEEQARGGIAVFHDGRWVKQPVPEPTMIMRKIQAISALARAHALLGEIEPALDQYQAWLQEYEFLSPHVAGEGRLLSAIRTEAHFMALRHHAATGRLVRDHEMSRINRLNLVSPGLVFTRDFDDVRPDERARVASRYDGRGHEYFDFAAPAGYQIDSVTLRASVEGIAEFAIDVPQPAGWPPQYSFSRRLTRHKFSCRGAYERATDLPSGTEFLSLGTSWGPGLFSNTRAEVEHWKANRPAGGQDVVRWALTFVVSPKTPAETASSRPHPGAPVAPVVRRVVDRHADGWEHASVVRDEQTVVYSGSPRLDVYGEDWLVYSLDGDIRIFHQRDLRLEIALPITINSREHEFDASLVRTHDGRHALLWARGTSKRNAKRFVSFSADLLRWETPQRVVFEEPPTKIGYTYARVEPLERTSNIVAVPDGYAMLLAQGFMRYSADLTSWGPPSKAIPQHLARNRLVRGRDGTLWAVYESSSPDLQPYTDDDRLSGFFVVDGRRYRHSTEIRVSRSVNGRQWEAAGSVTLPGQPSGLWAFAVDDRGIGIALGFNNLYVRWFMVWPFRDLARIDTQLPLMTQSEEAAFFVKDAALTCVRPVFDPEKQKPMLLATTTERVLGAHGTR